VTGAVVHIPDIKDDPEYSFGGLAQAVNYRSILAVPMLHAGRTVGAITVARSQPTAFPEQQIAVLKTFADQAVIAIENVRLFNETKESLERQTATAEILKVISESPSDIAPVFRAILEKATRLCDAQLGLLWMHEGGDAFRAVEFHGVASEFVNWVSGEVHRFGPPFFRPGGPWRAGQIPDVRDTDAFRRGDAIWVNAVEMAGLRVMLLVPLIREARLLGTIVIFRRELQPFTDKQIELVQTFANQAVIAIENVRLFNETKEALERQTATAEILKVIASSPSDVQPVFDAIVQSASRLFGRASTLRLVEGGGLRRRAMSEPADAQTQPVELLPIDSDSLGGRVVLEGKALQVVDTRAQDAPPYARAHGHKWSFRSNASAPLVRDGAVIGTVSVNSPEPGALSDKQMALLATFADQAVIAIQNVRLFNETKDALERQTATAEILKVIASSPSDVQPVFDAIASSALRIFDGSSVAVFLERDGKIHVGAMSGYDENMVQALREQFPRPLDRGTTTGRTILDRTIQHFPDVDAADVPAGAKAVSGATGIRAVLAAPMLRENTAIGAIVLSRAYAGAFPDKLITLLQTFADQAVIAIENVRLFNETREALERQTATAEILRVISSSPSDTRPVFEAIADACQRLFPDHEVGSNLLDESGRLYIGAVRSPLGDALRQYFARAQERKAGTAVKLRRTVAHYPDVDAAGVPEEVRAGCAVTGVKSIVYAPLVLEGRGIGSLWVAHRQPRPFAEKEIALLKTFADQAVIAIQNVRLFNETKESLERQTATAEILKVISSSPTDTQPVFDAILEGATRLCDAHIGVLNLFDGEHFRTVAQRGGNPQFAKWVFERGPFKGSSGGLLRLRQERQPFQVADVKASEGYRKGEEIALNFVDLGGARSLLMVPLVKENQLLGNLALYRPEVRPFSQKQVDLVGTFADQAVIAIENVRLFKELQSRTEALTKSVGQLTALGEVGQAISSTLDLETVLQTIVTRAVQLTGLDGGSIYEYDEQAEQLQLQAAENMTPDIADDIRKAPTRKGDGALGRTALTLEPTQVSDTLDESYQSGRKELLVRAGTRALLAVPLLREGHLLGAILVNRRTPGPFPPEVVELLKTFATQSAMAIQNARLFREIAEKGKQLEQASQHKSNFLASMSHELRTPLNAILGLNEMVLGEVYGEVPADMQPPLAQVQTSGKHLLRLVNNVLDLAKIEAGRMELALSDYSVQDTVSSVHATLQPLAAEKGLEFVASVPNDLDLAYGDGGRMAQCLMNLAGNSLKFTKAGKVEISAQEKDGLLTYRVTDTGVGIPADKIASLFTEFKQTDATIASEYGGTGLGLSISRKFVEMHGGRIWVESELGKGSAFIIEVPLRVST
jgi:GAF domain-containing protein